MCAVLPWLKELIVYSQTWLDLLQDCPRDLGSPSPAFLFSFSCFDPYSNIQVNPSG